MTEDKESWADIDGFPGYLVSNHGRVMNYNYERIKVASPNQQGIPSVNLIKDAKQNRRSVAVLVAKAFLPPPPRSAFDTPINLDGDRSNNAVDNLAWRPRWFAVKYHAQFKMDPPFNYRGGVYCTTTDEWFDTLRDAAMKYGLLEKEIFLSAHNRTLVFPTWYEFRLDRE